MPAEINDIKVLRSGQKFFQSQLIFKKLLADPNELPRGSVTNSSPFLNLFLFVENDTWEI